MRWDSLQWMLVAIATAIGANAYAGDGCCAHCGCGVPCQQVCRLECGEKKVDVFCWGCKKEDFCLACKSERGCKHCETVCDDCEANTQAGVCSKPKNFVWFEWLPGAGKIHTRTKLMRKTETVTVPSYKWVVEDMCAQCAASAAATNPGTVVYSSPLNSAPSGAEERSIFSNVRLPMFMTK